VIRITGTADSNGDMATRALLGDSLRKMGRAQAGTKQDIYLTGAALWPDPALAAACHQLREIALDTAAMLGYDALEIRPHEWGSIDQLRGWELAHRFLAGQAPYQPGGAEICCRGCLLSLACALASFAAFTTAQSFSDDHGAAETYVRTGGDLPRKPEPAPAGS
jgi:hypothetical protein